MIIHFNLKYEKAIAFDPASGKGRFFFAIVFNVCRLQSNRNPEHRCFICDNGSFKLFTQLNRHNLPSNCGAFAIFVEE